jgi:diaminopimelate decarboxylase
MQSLSSETLVQIANTYGTPVYVYNADKITSQFSQLKKAFESSNTRFFYACKALTNINVLKHILSIGCDIDCSSINEAKLAIHAGFNPKNILYTSNGILFSEIQEAVELGININIDSLSNLEKFGQQYGHSYGWWKFKDLYRS